MSKNITRKGLALGAGLGLVVSGFVGIAPASATETLALAPSAGAEYAALTTSSFVLNAGYAGTESTAAQGQLKFRVVNAQEAALEVIVTEGTDTSVIGYKTGTTSSPELDNDASTVSSDNATSDDDFVAYSQDGTPEIGATQSISIEPTAGFTSDITVTVQAFIDLDGSNSINGVEAYSPVRTITFYAAKNVSATATLKSLTLGTSAMTANVDFTPALNVRQLDSEDVVVKFLENNSVATVTAGGVFTPETEGYFYAAYDSTEKLFQADLTGLTTAISASTVYGARVYFWDGEGTEDADYAASAAATYSSPNKGEVETLASAAVRAGNAVSGSDIREGSGSFTVYADVSAVVTDASVAGQTVTFTFNGANLSLGASVTAGGKTLTSATAGDEITATAVSNADGEAELVVTYAGFEADDADSFTIEASAQGASAVIQGGADAAADLTLTAFEPVAAAVVDNVAGNRQVESVIGTTTTLSWTVVDKFGQVPPGTFQLVISEDGDATFAGTVAVTNGKATYSWVENATAADDYTVTAQLQKKNSSGVFATGTLPYADTLVSAVSAAQVPAAITNTAYDDGSEGEVALTLAKQVAVDEDIAQSTVSAPTISTNYVSGKVTNSAGAPLKGVAVTVSAGANIMLTSDDEKVHGIGSITVRTDTSGDYKVFVTSNAAGKQTITATSGSASKAEVITFAPADAATVKNISFVGSDATASSGSTFKIVATLTDKYGNPVKIVAEDDEDLIVTYTGQGLTLPTTLPVVTDSDGQLTFSVLLGSNDSKDATVVVGYDINHDGDLKDAALGDLSASWTVDVNPSAPAASGVVNAGSFNGYVAVFAKGYNGSRLSWKIAGKWFSTNVTKDYAVYQRKTVAVGMDVIVSLYIDGELELTKTVTTR